METAKEFTIFAALHEEANQPWVWLRSDYIKSRDIVRITRTDQNRSISCQARIIDDNFEAHYNEGPRIDLDCTDALVISDWYRQRLGGLETQTEYALKIRRQAGPWGRVRLYWDHPDLVVRMAFFLSMVSVGLGALSFALALATCRLTNRQESATSPVASVLLPGAELAKVETNCRIKSYALNVPSASLVCSTYNGSSYLLRGLTIEVPIGVKRRLYNAPELHVGSYEAETFVVTLAEPIYSDRARALGADPKFRALPPKEQWAMVNEQGDATTNPQLLQVAVKLVRAQGTATSP